MMVMMKILMDEHDDRHQHHDNGDDDDDDGDGGNGDDAADDGDSRLRTHNCRGRFLVPMLCFRRFSVHGNVFCSRNFVSRCFRVRKLCFQRLITHTTIRDYASSHTRVRTYANQVRS